MKYVVDGKEIILPDNMEQSEVIKTIEKRMANLDLKRPLVIRRKDGNNSIILNGVRMHGQRH
tara:strand:- start:1415 stop:1600 length:186 start_codon:yes stop_codon:yes gene_type:complete